MLREIVLDTETTGFEPTQGHKLVEIGCIELLNHLPTGRTFHTYINPNRDVPEDAFAVHGLSYEFLKTHPPFAEVISPFLEFIENSSLVIHNAKFDIKFLNAELINHQRGEIPFERAIDTLIIARKKFPGSPASLDALCKRFGIDNAARDKHGALLDAELLAKVYLELIEGKQPELSFDPESLSQKNQQDIVGGKEKKYYSPRPHTPTAEEKELHKEMLSKINIKI